MKKSDFDGIVEGLTEAAAVARGANVTGVREHIPAAEGEATESSTREGRDRAIDPSADEHSRPVRAQTDRRR